MREALRAYILQNFMFGATPAELDDDASLLESGILDSTSVLEMILDLEETYGLTGGHIYHGEQALDQLFTMRPLYGWAQYRTPIRRLYLCGAGTSPGGGLNGASGANASREIIRDLR